MSRLTTFASLGVVAFVVMLSASADAQPKKKKAPPAEKVERTVEVGADFNRQAAASAITEVNLSKCRATNAAKGEGHVTITFASTGLAQSATVDRGPWVGTPVAKCMAKAFKKAKVPAFKGDSVTVGKSFQFA